MQRLEHTRIVNDSLGKQPALGKQRKWVRGVSSPVNGQGEAVNTKQKQALSGWLRVLGGMAAGFSVSVAILEFRITTQVLKRIVERNAVSVLGR